MSVHVENSQRLFDSHKLFKLSKAGIQTFFPYDWQNNLIIKPAFKVFIFQTYKKVEQRISDIERKVIKTAQDEAELASLQAKQHQILSTGRPVNVVPQQPLQTTAPSHHAPPGQTSISQPPNQLLHQTITSQPGFITNQQTFSSIGQPSPASNMPIQSINTSAEMRLSGSNQQPAPHPVIASNNIKSGSQVIMSTTGQGGSIIRPVTTSQGPNKRIAGTSAGDMPPGSIVLPPGMSPAMAAGQHIQLMGAQTKAGPGGQPSILSMQGLKPVPQSELQASSGHIINPALPDIRQRFVPVSFSYS